MILQLIFIVVLIAVAAVVCKFVLGISSTLLKIAAHVIAGWLMLTIVNILPGIHIPINLITMLISGFGGVVGTVLLAIFYLIF